MNCRRISASRAGRMTRTWKPAGRRKSCAAAAVVFAAAGYADTDVQVIADTSASARAPSTATSRPRRNCSSPPSTAGWRNSSAEMDARRRRPDGRPARPGRDGGARVPDVLPPPAGDGGAVHPGAGRVPRRTTSRSTSTRRTRTSASTRRCSTGWIATGRLRPVPQERFFEVVGDLLYGTILTNLLTGRPADPVEQADGDSGHRLPRHAETDAGGNADRPGRDDSATATGSLTCGAGCSLPSSC